jgi:hypothetical protein
VERDYGIRIDSDQGEASEGGFTLSWTYDANAQELEIQCTKKPFSFPVAWWAAASTTPPPNAGSWRPEGG